MVYLIFLDVVTLLLVELTELYTQYFKPNHIAKTSFYFKDPK